MAHTVDGLHRRLNPGQGWFRPMLVASVALHALVLMMPIASDPEPAAEPEETPEETVQLSSLAALRQPPRPAPQPAPPVRPSPVAMVARPTPVLPKRTNPVPPVTPVVTPTPVATPTPAATPAATPSPQASATPSLEPAAALPQEPTPLTPADPLLPAFDPQGLQAEFAQSLTSVQGAIALPPPPDYFDQPERYFTALPDDILSTKDPSVWVPGIVGIDWFNDVRPNNALTILQNTVGEATLTEVPEGYGGHPLYEVQSPDGQPFLYLNIIPAPGNISTVVVQWSQNPNNPTNLAAGDQTPQP